jgi:hypothetical protein
MVKTKKPNNSIFLLCTQEKQTTKSQLQINDQTMSITEKKALRICDYTTNKKFQLTKKKVKCLHKEKELIVKTYMMEHYPNGVGELSLESAVKTLKLALTGHIIINHRMVEPDAISEEDERELRNRINSKLKRLGLSEIYIKLSGN